MIRLIIYLTFFSFLMCIESIALIIKKEGDIKHNSISDDLNFDLKYNKSIFSGDQILTGDNSFAKIVFLDDGSIVKIHQKSKVTIDGQISNRNINKELDISHGIFKMDINRQISKELIIRTPNSIVYNSYGSSLWINSESGGDDFFYGLSGKLEIKNIESGKISLLEPNTNVKSYRDGSMSKSQTSFLDLNTLNALERNFGEIIEHKIIENSNISNNLSSYQKKVNLFNTSNNDSIVHEVKIKLENLSGRKKELVIRYLNQ